MSNAENVEGLQQGKTGIEEDSNRLKEKRRSLEEKAKTLEERARVEKIAIDKKLAVQILEEENRTHNDAVRELEDKIASLEQQLKSSSSAESPPTEMASETEQATSDDVESGVSAGLLPPPEQSEVEVPREGAKKKRRNLF